MILGLFAVRSTFFFGTAVLLGGAALSGQHSGHRCIACWAFADRLIQQNLVCLHLCKTPYIYYNRHAITAFAMQPCIDLACMQRPLVR